MTVAFTTEGFRPKLQQRNGTRVRVYGTIDRFGKTRNENIRTVGVANVREFATNELLADHVWLRLTAADWNDWRRRFRSGDTVSFDGTIKTYTKGDDDARTRRLDFAFEDVANVEVARPTAPLIEPAAPSPAPAPLSPIELIARAQPVPMRLKDIEQHIGKVNLQDMKILQHLLDKEIEQREAEASKVFRSMARAKLLQMAKEAGISLEHAGISFEQNAGIGQQEDQGKGTPRYFHPANPAETWNGQGRHPRWLKEKVDAGHSKSEFLSSGTAP